MRMIFLMLFFASVASAAPTYPWLEGWADAPAQSRPIAAVFAPPDGFTRVPATPLTTWLRGLPVRQDRTEVRSFRGRALGPAKAVIALDVGTRDVQQCADSILRLHGEYLWATGRADKAAYHFTSGDRSAWRDWRRGERFAVKGSAVKRVRGRKVGGHAAYRKWLMHTFRYAGTRSLKHDSTAVGSQPIEPGDFYVAPGGPGHAVMVLDVATHPDGRRAALIGQGFMPAQDFHVVGRGGPRVLDGVWFLLPDAANALIATPSWAPFHRDHARRFKLR